MERISDYHVCVMEQFQPLIDIDGRALLAVARDVYSPEALAMAAEELICQLLHLRCFIEDVREHEALDFAGRGTGDQGVEKVLIHQKCRIEYQLTVGPPKFFYTFRYARVLTGGNG